VSQLQSQVESLQRDKVKLLADLDKLKDEKADLVQRLKEANDKVCVLCVCVCEVRGWVAACRVVRLAPPQSDCGQQQLYRVGRPFGHNRFVQLMCAS
jgi:hypothetical protein